MTSTTPAHLRHRSSALRLWRPLASVTGLVGAAVLIAGCAGAGSAVSSAEAECTASNSKLVNAGRSLDNEFYVSYDQAGKDFADSVDFAESYQWLASNNDSAKQVAQITQVLATSGRCTAINVDPNETAIIPAILDAAKKVGAYVVLQWSIPEGMTPESYGPTLAAYMSPNGEEQGYGVAKALFESMGGTGNIVALQGSLDNTAEIDRTNGMKRALEEFPGITVLESQPANWDRSQGQNLMQTFLTKYGDQINGVWAANDAIALGALSALDAKGRTDVGVVGMDGLEEALAEIEASDGHGGYIATTKSAAAEQGGFGLAIAFQAMTGQIDPATEPAEHRAFYLPTEIVNVDNVQSVIDGSDDLQMDFTDIWSVVGQPALQR